jgi:hypothetical protein
LFCFFVFAATTFVIGSAKIVISCCLQNVF